MKHTCTPEEYQTICEGLNQLTEILLVVGIVELKISKKEKLIFWDTEGKGQVDPKQLSAFFDLLDRHYFTLMEQSL